MFSVRRARQAGLGITAIINIIIVIINFIIILLF